MASTTQIQHVQSSSRVHSLVEHHGGGRAGLLEVEDVAEALHVPVADHAAGRLGEQRLRQQLDLAHDVGQPHRHLLAEKQETLLLRGCPPCKPRPAGERSAGDIVRKSILSHMPNQTVVRS